MESALKHAPDRTKPAASAQRTVVAPSPVIAPEASQPQPESMPSSDMLRLQQLAGNRAVQSLLHQKSPSSRVRHLDLRSVPQALEMPVRSRMENAFSKDFSGVRIHRGADANRSVERARATAFTVGQDIYFGAGKYAPESSEGAKLLAHELTHTLQQRQNAHASSPSTLEVGKPGDGCEREAHTAADHVVSGSPPSPVTPVGRRIQGNWLDDAKDALGDAVDVTTSTVTNAYNAVANAAGEAYDATAGAVKQGVAAVSDTVSAGATAVTGAVKSAVSGAVDVVHAVAGDPEKLRADTLAKVMAMRQRFAQADPDSIHATGAQISSLNSHISQLNDLSATASIPLLVPVGPPVGPAVAPASDGILGGIGEFILDAAVAELLAGVILILLILLVFGALLSSDTPVPDEKEGEKEKDKEKEEEDEEERKKREKEEEEKKKKKDDDEKRATPLSWNPAIAVAKVVGSGGIVGALVLGKGVPTPPTGLQFDAHHVWPKFIGGPEKQPLMGIFSFIHLSIMHPLMLNPLLAATFGVTNRTTDPKNIAFIARLRTDSALRLQVAAVLTGFYASLNSQTTPPIPAAAYAPGISSSLVDIPLLP
jgi:hypothetical protein